MGEVKIINDPVFGFIKIPRGILYGIVEHPLFQRLNRINQLGLASVVYPGARHTRFQHSLGAFHLMSEAIQNLQQKGQFIFDSEAEAVQAAILMHDIGHGPFSHVLENTLISGISHEEISLMMMEEINRSLNGQLNLAISIFKGEYPKNFLHQLISSQLDMDRLDYLRRDSFYTGVTEGNIGSARIIKMLNVVDDSLVVEQKGIYSLENYLTTRRLMYWQVYLHRTCVAYEKVLVDGKNPLRNCLIHCELTGMDLLEYIKKTDTLIAYQPVFLQGDQYTMATRFKPELIKTSLACKTVIDMGIHASYGTDSPVEDSNPFANIYCAVNRKDLTGKPEEGWNTQECVTVEQAIDAYTVESAYMEFAEEYKGRIKPGYYADLEILDTDIFTCDPMDIIHILPELVMVGGEIVLRDKIYQK